MMKSTVLTGVVGTLALLLAMGCATTYSSKGPSDEESIATLLKSWEAGVMAADADKILATYSDKFAHTGYDYSAPDKAALREFLLGGIDEGNFDDVELDFEYAETEIEGGVATIFPIEYTIAEGTISIELTAKKEGSAWLFTDMEIEGL
jgi:hypothetical protein